MIECDPGTCAEMAMAQKDFIRETIPLVVLAGAVLVFKSRVRHVPHEPDARESGDARD